MLGLGQKLPLKNFQLWLVRAKKFDVTKNKNETDFIETECIFLPGLLP